MAFFYNATLISNDVVGASVAFGVELETDDPVLIALPDITPYLQINQTVAATGGLIFDYLFTWVTITGDTTFNAGGIANIVITLLQSVIIPTNTQSGQSFATLDAYHATSTDLDINVNGNVFTTMTFFPACFQKGTNILTPEGYKPVESLKTGDLVTSAKDTTKSCTIKSMLRFFGTEANCPLYCLPKDTLGENKPARDLFLSSRHRFQVDGQLRHMICMKDLAVKTNKAHIEYYHIELENCFDTVLAEGLEVETFIDPRIVAHDWECTEACCTYIPIGPQPASALPELALKEITA